MNQIITLYKPLTPAQLAAVIDSGWRCFIPDHPEQKNFYLKLTRNYAELIARMWSTPRFSAGYVAELNVEDYFINQYKLDSIAYGEHREYCIPVSELPSLNRHLIGPIDIVSAFHLENQALIENVSLQNCQSFH